MKYVCKVCGFVYDETKQDIPFSDLPDSWTCPVCSVTKSSFAPEGTEEKPKVAKRAVIHTDMGATKLNTAELSALCSNLARGCEKQYRAKESELFKELADYFAAVSPIVKDADIESLKTRLQDDLSAGYSDIKLAAADAPDRGAGRVCVWGEKVSAMLLSLLERYIKDGDKILADTEIRVCSICGFISIGEEAPALCPVCKVPDWKFDKIERRAKA